MKRLILFVLAIVTLACTALEAQPDNAELKKFNQLCNDGALEEAVDSGKVNFDKIMLFFKGKDDETFHLFMWNMFQRTARQQEGMIFFLNKFEEYAKTGEMPIHAYFWLDMNFKFKNLKEARRCIDVMAEHKMRGLNLEYARYYAASGDIDSATISLRHYFQRQSGLSRSSIAYIPEFRALLTADGYEKYPDFVRLFEEPNNVKLPNEFTKTKLPDKEFAGLRDMIQKMSIIPNEDMIDTVASALLNSIYSDKELIAKSLQNILEMMETAPPSSYMKHQLAALALSSCQDSAVAARVVRSIINDNMRQNPRLCATIAFIASETNPVESIRIIERIYADMKPETVNEKLCSDVFSGFTKRIFMMLQARSRQSITTILENAPDAALDSLLSVLKEVYEPSTLPFLKKKVERAHSSAELLRYLRFVSEIPSYNALKIINESINNTDSLPIKDSIELIKKHCIAMTNKLLSMEETVHRETKVNMMWDNPEKSKDEFFKALIIENASRNLSAANCIYSLDIQSSDFPSVSRVCAKLIYEYSEDSFIILMKLKIQMLIAMLRTE